MRGYSEVAVKAERTYMRKFTAAVGFYIDRVKK